MDVDSCSGGTPLAAKAGFISTSTSSNREPPSSVESPQPDRSPQPKAVVEGSQWSRSAVGWRSVGERVQCLPLRPPRRVPRPALPSGAGRARGRVLHAGGVEGRAPAALVVLSQLEVKALAVHPDRDPPDTGPGVEPGPQRPESTVVGWVRKPGEAECCSQDPPAGVEHAPLVY